MFDQFSTQSATLGKNYADTFVKAQSLALAGIERIAELNLKTIEDRVKASVGFFAEATEVRDFESARTFWPKGVHLVKENAEKLYANAQEVFGISLKTSQAMGALAKGSLNGAGVAMNDKWPEYDFEGTNEAANKTAGAAGQAAR